MKRIGDLYDRIISIENLEAADMIARKGKTKTYGVRVHMKSQENNLASLHRTLAAGTFQTSEYDTFKVYEPKERLVYRLPYFPDRIVHHAVMNVLEPIFVSCFTADTYSCIKGRGIHAAFRSVRNALNDVVGTQYCLKLDIKKFYPSVDHDILKVLLRRKIKDYRLLQLLDGIIDSAEGLPIGNYLSQYLANFYLTYFDHWIKEVKGVKYYFRYADDLVILSADKAQLHDLRIDIANYLATNLKLQVKENWQVFPVAARSLDFIGYRFYHTHTHLRKSIKKRFARMVAKRPNMQSFAAYYGWACHADTNNLIKTLYEKVRRSEYNTKSNPERVNRRKNQNRKNHQPGDIGDRIQDREIEIPGKGQREVPAHADKDGKQHACRLYQLSVFNGCD